MADLRALPSIDALLQRPGVRALAARFGHDAAVTALRASVAALRSGASPVTGPVPDRADLAAAIEDDAATRLDAAARGSLRPAINATGVILHTNLGRAPLAEPAIARIAAVARGYSTLEYDLAGGRRGSRTVHAERLLTAITGAEAAVVVNNNAAAVLLLLSALARGREVVLSRGELVEIGGGFRVPEVMAQSGAHLREVGTTNRTRVSDYVAGGAAAALWMRVHPSNFRVEGFTERPPLADLVAAARTAGVPLVEDLGSGNLDPEATWEPTVQASLAAGVDLVCVSGDKLLGGPQAGLVLGRRALVDRLRSHPLMRAVRVDKLTYAALEATLIEYWAGRARETVPVPRMLHLPLAAVRARAEAVATRLRDRGWQAEVIAGESTIGGGSAPGVTVPTALVRLARDGWSADHLEAWLRERETPIIARIQDDAVVMDLRTVAEGDDTVVLKLLTSPSPGPRSPGPA